VLNPSAMKMVLARPLLSGHCQARGDQLDVRLVAQ
jgi:hypothetical protein